MPYFCRSSYQMPIRSGGQGAVRIVSAFGKNGSLLALIALALLFSLRIPAAQGADNGWQAVISDHSAVPAYLVAVDKSKQELAFFERRSPLRLARVFACTTGQAVGDKIVQGDLKTPEGIYFVGHRIGSGLDFIKYGNEAYTLNYPNPVDRLRKKTGYGIWIHGRGETLTPLQTEGCVSMNNEDLTHLSPALIPGTPVALADTLAFSPAPDPKDAKDVQELERKVQEWAEAWSARSTKYFDLYDAHAYSLATESFSAFKAQKERLFKSLPWIRTSVRDIQALKGPGYWVTWFYQDYQAPNLTSRGVRRLYWTKDSAGTFKILGMEWQPGLDTSRLLASAEPLVAPASTDAGPLWPKDEVRLVVEARKRDGAPAQTDSRASAFAGQELASSGQSAGQNAPQNALWTPVAPEKGQDDGHTAGATVAEAPGAHAAPSAALPAAPEKSRPDMPRPSPQAFLLAEAMKKNAGRANAAESKNAAPAKAANAGKSSGSAGSAHAAAQRGDQSLNLPPPLPAQGLAGSAAPTTPLLAEKPAREEKPAPASGRGQAHKALLVAETAPSSHATSGQEAGALGHESTKAVTQGQKAAPRTQAAPSLAELADELAGVVENWRAAWEKGDVEAYMAFYAPNARQGSRTTATAIRRQKEQLWARSAPATVHLEDVRVRLDKDTALADMRQEYADSKGSGDVGLKTLIFQQINGEWLIIREDWNALSDETGN